ncbi:MAG: TVP38/TMEM64 family protein [Chloroflexaceae bacterium]|nr:TVP38/TMEM64 family protein [Chloroflexaceae bacterium]
MNKPDHDTCRPGANDDPAIHHSWMHRYGLKLLLLGFWLLVLGGYQWYAWQHNLSLVDVAAALIHFLGSSPYGPIIFILLYALRPLIFFSATVLSVTAGIVFGPVWGLIYTVIGSNASALVAYTIGRFAGTGIFQTRRSRGMVQRYADRMRQHSFLTTLTLRLLFVHYDLLSYLAGFADQPHGISGGNRYRLAPRLADVCAHRHIYRGFGTRYAQGTAMAAGYRQRRHTGHRAGWRDHRPPLPTQPPQRPSSIANGAAAQVNDAGIHR